MRLNKIRAITFILVFAAFLLGYESARPENGTWKLSTTTPAGSQPRSPQTGNLGSPKTISGGKGQAKSDRTSGDRGVVVRERIVRPDKPVPAELQTRVRLYDVTAYVTEKPASETAGATPEADTRQSKPRQSPFSVKFSKEVLEVLRDSTDGKDENPWLLFMNRETGVIDRVTNLYGHGGEDSCGFERGFPEYAQEKAIENGYFLAGLYHVHPGKTGRVTYDMLSGDDSPSIEAYETHYDENLGLITRYIENGVIGGLTPLGLLHDEKFKDHPARGLVMEGKHGTFEIIPYMLIIPRVLGPDHPYLSRIDEFKAQGYLGSSRFDRKGLTGRALVLNIEVVPGGSPLFDRVIEPDQQHRFMHSFSSAIPHQQYSELLFGLKSRVFEGHTLTDFRALKAIAQEETALHRQSQRTGKLPTMQSLKAILEKRRIAGNLPYSRAIDHFDFSNQKLNGVIKLDERFDGKFSLVAHSQAGRDFVFVSMDPFVQRVHAQGNGGKFNSEGIKYLQQWCEKNQNVLDAKVYTRMIQMQEILAKRLH
jgi:hypothetical protein